MSLIRTLVVDDDQEIAGVHSGFLLAHGGFDVVGVANSGGEALEKVRELKPELMLLDIHLPDMSGIDVLRAARNIPGDPVDIIAITAARELETVRAAMAGGVLHYLVKPFNSKVLMGRLDDYVQHRARIVEHSSFSAGPLDQERIDRLLAATPTEAPQVQLPVPGGSLPKGLSQPTLDSVVGALRASGVGFSASEVAAQLGLARVSARRYLEYLVTKGSARIVPKYGAAGRPEKFYVWTGAQR
ncbi:response regulator [Arthrobacter tumbae]|uniref:response regulator n=1 Tax=Arthrobacter tumbae TaxID=163874 RepID=UPI0019568B47|nr:response regulator [Arthrobacter tumbae]MBM7781312.1 two-component system CitB family response regulator [Arthrobacter tumbae]